jgi:hypothetical protein
MVNESVDGPIYHTNPAYAYCMTRFLLKQHVQLPIRAPQIENAQPEDDRGDQRGSPSESKNRLVDSRHSLMSQFMPAEVRALANLNAAVVYRDDSMRMSQLTPRALAARSLCLWYVSDLFKPSITCTLTLIDLCTYTVYVYAVHVTRSQDMARAATQSPIPLPPVTGHDEDAATGEPAGYSKLRAEVDIEAMRSSPPATADAA